MAIATGTARAKQLRRARKMNRIRENWMLYLFLLPTLAWFVIFHYWPLYGVQIAFQKYKIGQSFGSSEWVGLKYFRQFFSSYWFPTVMRNTITISLLNFSLSFPLPIVLALLLNEVNSSICKKTVQTITYAPPLHFDRGAVRRAAAVFEPDERPDRPGGQCPAGEHGPEGNQHPDERPGV